MEKVCGIYKITNIQNNKIYIGSAVNIINRFKTHKRLLKNKKHFNTHLQSSYNTYGAEKFKYEIIEITESVKMLDRELYWIKLLESNNPEYGYNKRIIVNSNLGIKLSEETKKKLSESHLGHKRSDETNKKIIESQYKAICQFDKNGNFIKKYHSLQDASKSLGVNYTTSITMCLKKKIPSALGFLWCYEEEKPDFTPTTSKKERKIKITCLLTKKITIFDSIKQCIEKMSLSRPTIHRRLKEKKYKNLLWEKI